MRVKRITICCEKCAVELIEDDVLEQDIYPKDNSAYQYKIWHCPICDAKYSGNVWYAISVQQIDIKED